MEPDLEVGVEFPLIRGKQRSTTLVLVLLDILVIVKCRSGVDVGPVPWVQAPIT